MPSPIRPCLIASLFFLLSLTSHATIVVSDFSSFAGQLFPPMGISWSNAGTDQYIQNVGSISIAPVSGGDPKGDGYFVAGMLPTPGTTSVNFTGLDTVSLTARVDAGNASSLLTILFFDSTFNTAVASATFPAASLQSTFSTVNMPLTLTGVGNLANVTYWKIQGDNLAGDAFRFSFDNLTVATVPEPGTVILLGLGMGGAMLRRRVLRAQVPAHQ